MDSSRGKTKAGRARGVFLAAAFGTIYGLLAWAAHALLGFEPSAAALGFAAAVGYFTGREDAHDG